MIKISSLLTNILFIFVLVGCSGQQIDEYPKEDEITRDTKKLVDKQDFEQTESSEPSLISGQRQPKRPIQDQSKDNKTLVDKSTKPSATHPDNAFEKERYYIETPTKNPTLGSQSSKHEREYRPETLDQNTSKEDQHSETSPPQPEADKTQTPNTQASRPTSKQDKSKKQDQQSAHQPSSHQQDASNNTQNKLNKPKNKLSNLDKEASKQQNTEKHTVEEIKGQKENRLTTENAHQTIKDDSSGEGSVDNNQEDDISRHSTNNSDDKHAINNTNPHNHEANGTSHHDHHDHHPHTGEEDEHLHVLKKKSKRHWNMQRMIKSKNPEL